MGGGDWQDFIDPDPNEFAACPFAVPHSCTLSKQTYVCYGQLVSGEAAAVLSGDSFRTTSSSGTCSGAGTLCDISGGNWLCDDNAFCETSAASGTCSGEGTDCQISGGNWTCENQADCSMSRQSNSDTLTCSSAICDASVGTSDDTMAVYCKDLSHCSGEAWTGNSHMHMYCDPYTVCNGSVTTGSAQTTVHCAEGATCTCQQGVLNSVCTVVPWTP